MTTNKKLFVFLLLPFLALSCTPNQNIKTIPDANYNRPLKVGNKNIFVDVADTDLKRQEGLSGRNNLTDEQGMLFTFGSELKPAFWMIDMKFNLDLIWIDKNKIVGVTADVPIPPICEQAQNICNSKLPLYYPPAPVDTVLEVNSGWAKKYNIEPGEVIELKNNK